MRHGLPVACALGLAFGGAAVFAQSPEPSPPVALPDLSPGEGWQEVETSTPDTVRGRAWSDPADGCHLALFETPAGKTAAVENIAISLGGTLAKDDYEVGEPIIQPPTIRLPLQGAGATGIADLHVVEGEPGKASLLACYWSEREPARCRAICEHTLQTQLSQRGAAPAPEGGEQE